MQLATVDFETYWDSEHSLSKMDPIQYVMSPKTELQLMSIKIDGYPTDVLVGEDEMQRTCRKLDWSTKLVIAHNNSGFDALIMAWRLGIRPAMWGCTLAMARPLHAKTVGLGLGKLVQHYGIGVKDNTALVQTRGKCLADFTPQELDALIRYNRDGDTEQCYALFHRLKKHFTPAEMWHIDCNIRMMVEPEFRLNTALLETALSVERSNKHKALLDLAQLLQPEGLDWGDEPAVAEWVREQMASSAKFAAVLESRGVPVPLKRSPKRPEQMIPAIAKTDEAMEELLDHDDEVVQAAARARLSTKSTQLETRIQSFLGTYKTLGKLPVPAHYCGADTTGRDSGFLYNMLNLPRINKKKPKVSDALRNSIEAPPGKVILVRDLSGIELRVNHTLWRVARSMKLWQENPKADLYIGTAAAYYKVPESEITKEDPRRQLGKVFDLSCGFGIGHVKLRSQARAQYGLRLTLEEAKAGVDTWRALNPEIAARKTGGWALCDDALHYIARGDKVRIDPLGLCTTEKDAIVLPSGRRIRYPDLRQEWVKKHKDVDGQLVVTEELTWVYAHGRHQAYLYGGKVDENCVSGDALVLTDSGYIRLADVTQKHRVHDGVDFVPHGGLVYRGVQPCVTIDGVSMTPDHEVLTDDGWRAAAFTPRPYRPSLRRTDRATPPQQRREEDAVAVPMPVRSLVREARHGRYEGTAPGGHTELRVFDGDVSPARQPNARTFTPPGVRGVGEHARALHAPDAPGVEELRGPRAHCCAGVDGVLSVLGGHAGHVRTGPDFGSHRQRCGLFARELPLGRYARPDAQSAGEQERGYTPARPEDRNTKVDAVLQAEAQPATCAVYDLLNCGPRQRFVVLGESGPFIVHNCVQAMARDILFPQAIEFFKRTRLRPKHKVYDELVYVVDAAVADELSEMLGEIMSTSPSYWPELILTSEGDSALTYGACK